MTEKLACMLKLDILNVRNVKTEAPAKIFVLSCLSLLKHSVEVREDRRVLFGGIQLPSSRRLPLPLITFSTLSNSKAKSSYLICRCFDTIHS